MSDESVIVGDDGLARCAWSGSAPEYLRYHDDEWAVPVRGVQAVFERLTLEGFQSGLSWLIILRKRENFRAAFDGFDLTRIANYGSGDIDRLLSDAGIVRNRQKIEATINNARAALAPDEPLDEIVWSFAPPARETPLQQLSDVPATSPESVAMSKALKRLGFRFIGPTTAYAAMQAMGLVNDHVAQCHRAGR